MVQRKVSMTKYILPLGLVIVFFSGCVSVTKELPPFSTYTLELKKGDKNDQKFTNKSVSIIEPKALNSINNILVTYKDNEFRSESYALSKWSDKPTKMLQYMMVSYLSNTKNFNFVHSNKMNLPSDIKILSELDNFTQYLDGDKAFVKLSIRVFVIENNTLNTKEFSYTKQCVDQSAKGSVKALNFVVNKFLEDLNRWIIK